MHCCEENVGISRTSYFIGLYIGLATINMPKPMRNLGHRKGPVLLIAGQPLVFRDMTKNQGEFIKLH